MLVGGVLRLEAKAGEMAVPKGANDAGVSGSRGRKIGCLLRVLGRMGMVVVDIVSG